MKARGLEYLFYETSALTGQNLDEFAKQFGMCWIHARHACTYVAYPVIIYIV